MLRLYCLALKEAFHVLAKVTLMAPVCLIHSDCTCDLCAKILSLIFLSGASPKRGTSMLSSCIANQV